MVKTYIDEFLGAGAALANVAILSLEKPAELQDDLSRSMATYTHCAIRSRKRSRARCACGTKTASRRMRTERFASIAIKTVST